MDFAIFPKRKASKKSISPRPLGRPGMPAGDGAGLFGGSEVEVGDRPPGAQGRAGRKGGDLALAHFVGMSLCVCVSAGVGCLLVWSFFPCGGKVAIFGVCLVLSLPGGEPIKEKPKSSSEVPAQVGFVRICANV